MKKKIRELTIDEVFKMKNQCQKYESCEECKNKNFDLFNVCDVSLDADESTLETYVEVDNND